jgi:hypothetical protein
VECQRRRASRGRQVLSACRGESTAGFAAHPRYPLRSSRNGGEKCGSIGIGRGSRAIKAISENFAGIEPESHRASRVCPAAPLPLPAQGAPSSDLPLRTETRRQGDLRQQIWTGSLPPTASDHVVHAYPPRTLCHMHTVLVNRARIAVK